MGPPLEHLRGLGEGAFVEALRAAELTDAERADHLLGRLWSPRAIAYARELSPEAGPARDFVLRDDLQRLASLPELELLRSSMLPPPVPGAMENALTTPDGRRALCYWPANPGFFLNELLDRSQRTLAVEHQVALAEVVVERVRAGFIAFGGPDELVPVLLRLPAVPGALAVVERKLLTKKHRFAATAWLTWGCQRGIEEVVAWVRGALEDEKRRPLALPAASHLPEAAPTAASAPGDVNALHQRALALWRQSRSGPMGEAIVAAVDPPSEAQRALLVSETERGFHRHWVAGVKGKLNPRALAESLTWQRAPVSELSDRISHLPFLPPHPAVARAALALVTDPALASAKKASLWQRLEQTIAHHADEATRRQLLALAPNEVPAGFDAARCAASIRAGERDVPGLEEVIEALGRLPRAVPLAREAPRESPVRDFLRGKGDPAMRQSFEALLRAEAPSPELLGVVGDQLLQANDERGLALQHLRANARAELAAVLKAHATRWAGPLAGLATRDGLGFTGPMLVTRLAVSKRVLDKQRWFDAVESDELRAVTHLFIARSYPSLWVRALVSRAAEHRLRLVAGVPAKALPALPATVMVAPFVEALFFGPALRVPAIGK